MFIVTTRLNYLDLIEFDPLKTMCIRTMWSVLAVDSVCCINLMTWFSSSEPTLKKQQQQQQKQQQTTSGGLNV